jgi:aspartyl-tRNA(Asn)/glutamyl-tRNA(Gln) amidotransferase subunit C
MLASCVVPPTLTAADVRRIAALARLELDDAEVEHFTSQLTAILQYASEVQSIDTSSVPPMSHAAGAGALFREDTIAPSMPRDEALANAPDADRDAGLFRVPKVL